MKISNTLLILFGIITFSCNNQNSSSNSEKNIKNLNDNEQAEILKQFKKQLEDSPQTFKLSSSKPSKVTGKFGTIISVIPEDLEMENSQPIGLSIEIELKELINKEQLLRANTQTVSDGKLLISGGAYYINLTSDGQQVKLKKGHSLNVKFPKLTDEEMSLFYGERDSLERMNWKLDNQKFISKPNQNTNVVTKDSTSSKPMDDLLLYLENGDDYKLTPEERKKQKRTYETANKVYETIKLNNFGWINCDKFYDIKIKTNLIYSFKNSDSISSAEIYLIFKDYNSLMLSTYNSSFKEGFYYGFQNIPEGAAVTLIGISIKNGELYSYRKDLKIEKNKNIEINFTKTPKNKIKELFKV